MVVLVICFSNFPGISAQSAGPSYPTGLSYVPKNWKLPEWLSHSPISDIAQTPDGYLWLATQKGLVRFDGIRFKLIDFDRNPTKKVAPDCLFVDRGGILWIGGPGMLTRYHSNYRHFKSYTEQDGMTGNRVQGIIEDFEGHLWLGFAVSYINRFDKNKKPSPGFSPGLFTPFNNNHGLEGKKIIAMMEDAGGAIWVCTRENGLFVKRNGRFSKCKFLPEKVYHNRILTSLCQDDQGNVWAGSTNGLIKISPVTGGTVIYNTSHGLSHNYVTDILKDYSGQIWVGTVRGLDRLKTNPSGNSLFERELKKHSVHTLFEDREHILWAATGSVLFSLRPATFSFHPLTDVPVHSMCRDPGGGVWLGSYPGKILHFTGKKCFTLPALPGVTDTSISALELDGSGNLWCGTDGKGIFKINKKNLRYNAYTTRDGLADNQIISLLNDSRDILWAGTYAGLSRYLDGQWTSFKAEGGIKGNFVNNVYEDKRGHIWLATNKGLVIITNPLGDRLELSEFLVGTPIASIAMQEDAVWLLTHGAGLIRFKDGGFTSCTGANGLGSDFIYQLLADDMGYFWITTDAGIIRVSSVELNRFADGELDIVHSVKYGVSDGMRADRFYNFFSRHSVLAAPNGEFWFATQGCISIVNPDLLRINKLAPPVVIEAIHLGLPPGLEDQSFELPSGYKEIPFGKADTWRFRFTSPSYISPRKIRFKYKLEPHDKNWLTLKPGAPREARYKKLRHGKYVFRVRSCNSDGVWNLTGAAFPFSVATCYYENTWFKILAPIVLVLTLLGGFLGFKRWFRKRAEKKKYQGSPLNPIYVEECLKKLDHLMRREKIYRDENLSLQILAGRIDLLPRYLSQIINEKKNMNFSDYVNGYRIDEARELLSQPNGSRKILAIAFEVGFNTKAAFNIAFKKQTGMTPSQYKKTSNGQT